MIAYEYYHRKLLQTLKFLVKDNRRLLYVGPQDDNILKNLKPTAKIIVDKNKLSKKPAGKYDYIFLNSALGIVDDVVGLLAVVRKYCSSKTRIIVYQHNYLWQWLISIGEVLKIKREEGIENWLSMGDLVNYLESAGFETTRVFKRNIFPFSLYGIGRAINFIGVLLPFFDFFKIDQFIIARPDPNLYPNKLPKSLTVVITVKDEKENIEPVVKLLPEVCNDQEILFVEGHSTDGTREEILRVKRKYPGKNIRVIGQPGKGQGDAIRVGYKKAKGDVIILYEGDQTSNPGDLKYFYDAMSKGRFEFVEGSRFVYPLDTRSMPLINQIGNIFFAKWFSFFLGQRATDVLSGIKATLKRDYDTIYDNWGFLGFNDPFGDFELLFGSARMGLKFGEIPMRYYPRVYGRTKTNPFKHGFYLLKMAVRGYWVFRFN